MREYVVQMQIPGCGWRDAKAFPCADVPMYAAEDLDDAKRRLKCARECWKFTVESGTKWRIISREVDPWRVEYIEC